MNDCISKLGTMDSRWSKPASVTVVPIAGIRKPESAGSCGEEPRLTAEGGFPTLPVSGRSIMCTYNKKFRVCISVYHLLSPTTEEQMSVKITCLQWLVYLSPSPQRNNSQRRVKLTINTGIDFSGNELA